MRIGIAASDTVGTSRQHTKVEHSTSNCIPCLLLAMVGCANAAHPLPHLHVAPAPAPGPTAESHDESRPTASRPDASPTVKDSSTVLPAGWWEVVDSEPPEYSDREGLTGTMWRFHAEGYDVVQTDGTVGRWNIRWAPQEPNMWRGSQSGIRLTIAKEEVVLESEQDDGGRLILRRPSPQVTPRLDRLLSGVPSAAATCEQAKRCCEDGLAMFNETCDNAWQLGDMKSSEQCAQAARGILILLRTGKYPVPPACDSFELKEPR